MSTKSPDQDEAACDAYFATFGLETTEDEESDIAPSTSAFVSIIRKIICWKDPMLEPRKRPGAGGHPSTTPARIQHLEKRVLMSANPLLTGIDAPNWDAAPDGLRGEMTPQAGTFIYDFDISPDGTEFVTTNKDGSLTFYNALTGDARLTIADHPSYCSDIDYSPDGLQVATAGSDNSVNLRDAQTGNLLKSLKFSGSCSTIAFSPDGNTLAVGVYEQSIHVIDLRTGTDRTIAYDGALPVCTFSADGSTIAVTGKNSVALYSTATLQKTNTFTGLVDNAYALEFDATGRFVIAGDNAGHVTVWDRTTGQMVDETADLRGHPQVAGGIRSMNVTADGKAIGVVDWSGNGIVYDMGQLTAGQGLTEMMRFNTKGSGWGVEFSPSGKSVISSGTAANVTTLQVFAIPEPPAPPSTASSNTDAPDEPVSPTSGTDATPDINATVMSLAAERMEELETSIHDVAEDIPALIRRQAELERDLTAKAGPLAAQQKTVDALRKTHADTVTAYQRYQAEYDATVKRSPKTAAKIKPLLENAWRSTYYLADQVREQEAILNGLIAAEQAVRQELTTVASALQTSYAELSNQRAEFVACAELAGTSVDIAIEQVDIIVRAAVKEGEEALPHLRATIDVRDRNATSYDPRILVLDTLVTEVQSHQIPSNATKLDVLFRVTNDGNRDGYVTVTIGGVSDLSPDLYKPQTVTIFLRAGEKRDISAIVEIPQGSDGKRTGGFGITVTTLDEATVALQVTQKGATPMLTDAEKKLNEMPGAAAAYHNAQVILLSEGIGTPEERLERYLAANPTQASLIAGMMESGELKADLAFNESFLTAYRAATSVAGKMANEVVVGMGEMNSMTEIDAETLLFANAAIDGVTASGVSIDLANALSFIRLQKVLDGTPQTEIYAHVMNRYTDSTPLSYPVIQGITVRDDTAAGKAFMSVYQQGFGGTEDQQKLYLLELSSITGVSAQRLWVGMRNANYQEFFAAMKSEFERVGLEHIFGAEQPTSTPVQKVLTVQLDKSTYTSNDSGIHVSFDLSGTDPSFDHFSLYLCDANGQQIPNMPPLVENIRGSLSTTIPWEAFRHLSMGNGLNGDFSLRLAVWKNPTDVPGIPGNIVTHAFHININADAFEQGANQHLSVTDNPVENAILDELADMNNFFVRGNGWRRTIASDYHLGDHLFAMDLNKGSGDADDNEAVYTPTEADVEYVNFDPASGISTVILKHTAIVNGQPTVWKTKYLHMDKVGVFDDNGNVVGSLVVGMHLKAGQRIGEVGDVGASGQVHLHVEVLHADDTLIDTRNLLKDIGVETKAWDPAGGGELSVEWDASLKVWKGSEVKNAGLVFVTDANQYSGGESNVWVAWDSDQTNRERVVWINKLPSGQIIDAWLNYDHSKKWNTQTLSWENL